MLFRFFILLFFAGIAWAEQVQPQSLPLEAYGRLPDVEGVKLSPDGKHILFQKNLEGKSLLVLMDSETLKSSLIAQSDNKKVKFNWYTWANNEVILISGRFPDKRYQTAVTETRLLKYNINNDKGLEIAYKPRRSTAQGGQHFSQFQDNVVSLLPGQDQHFLLAVDADTPNYPSVLKVDLYSRKQKRILRSRSYIHDWYADQQGEVRLGYGRDETKIFYTLKDEKEGKWRRVWEYEIFETPDITVLGFDADPNILYVRSIHNGRYAIFKTDLSKEKLDKKLVYADPHYDVEGRLIRSSKDRRVIGVRHGEATNGRVYWDKSAIAFQKAIDNALPNAGNVLVSFSNDERRYILLSYQGDGPGVYFYGDRDKGDLIPFAEQYPMLNEHNLAGKEKILFKARDGLQLEGYLTKPLQAKADEPLPTIILPHGGPMARDYNGFDWLSEFLANRGYLVLQPNFRGSSGYGFEFEMASVQGWGQGMQNDLQDAANWLIEQKMADPKRICIVGASYGGYAALMGVAKQGETFKCAASINGVTNLKRIVQDARKYTNKKVVRKQLGDDYDVLEAYSPYYLADNISAPVLLIHGEMDRVVPVRHSRMMADELQDLKRKVTYVELEEGNHYLEIEKNRLATLAELEKFLAANI